jgi:hypothetical protein
MHNRNHKLNFLKQTIDLNNLGVLGLQESHFDPESATQFDNIFCHWFKLYYSAHPEKPTSTAGVAFVLNKKFLDTKNICEYELIPREVVTDHQIVDVRHRPGKGNVVALYSTRAGLNTN